MVHCEWAPACSTAFLKQSKNAAPLIVSRKHSMHTSCHSQTPLSTTIYVAANNNSTLEWTVTSSRAAGTSWRAELRPCLELTKITQTDAQFVCTSFHGFGLSAPILCAASQCCILDFVVLHAPSINCVLDQPLNQSFYFSFSNCPVTCLNTDLVTPFGVRDMWTRNGWPDKDYLSHYRWRNPLLDNHPCKPRW